VRGVCAQFRAERKPCASWTSGTSNKTSMRGQRNPFVHGHGYWQLLCHPQRRPD
jgi:hypothetical protein